MKTSKERTIWLICYGILGLLFVFDSFSLIFARKVASRAQSVLSLLASFPLGETSRAEVETQFKNIGVG